MSRVTYASAIILIAALATTAAAQWVPSPVIHDAVQLMGFSTGKVTGDAGILAMVAECHADFPASRVCTSEEVLNTTAIFPISTTDSAWIRPSYAVTGASFAMDASGVVPGTGIDATLTCIGWTYNGTAGAPRGLTVSPNGNFSPNYCDTARPVACCTLIQVPEPTSSMGIGAGAVGLAALSQTKRVRR